MRIFLLGFMGCGKTTIGKALAKELAYTFLDTDEWIEKEAGKSVSQIFKQDGEAHFRSLESKCIESVRAFNNVVVSTGGGMPCSIDNINVLNQLGITLHLYLTSSQLTERLYGDGEEGRPLLKNLQTKEEMKSFIVDKLAEREHFYFRSKMIIDANDTIDGVVLSIRKELDTRLG